MIENFLITLLNILSRGWLEPPYIRLDEEDCKDESEESE